MNSFVLLDDEDEPSPNGILGYLFGDGGRHSGVFGQLMGGAPDCTDRQLR
jgi:hypothetical protein